MAPQAAAAATAALYVTAGTQPMPAAMGL